MQELWDTLAFDDSTASPDKQPAEQILLALSYDAQTGSHSTNTIQFTGAIQGKPIVVLVDSGSSSSFLAASIADQLIHLPRISITASVKIANGNLLRCTAMLPSCKFVIMGHQFKHDLKILPLDSYDLILGMDWLEQYSPMNIRWKSKWLSLPYQGTTIVLQGLTSPPSTDLVFQLLAVDSPESSDTPTPLPAEIAALIHEFPGVFTAPSSLPPARSCDHAILLVSGASPVNIRAYRYPPTLKDEIERQITDMLDKGFIQSSTSPFSSPVLLVRKKDGSWRFCVDYRYLNAMTVKSVYPIPVFDQLVDELGQASWFSILDLHSGYHQIRLQPGEEFKTAFSTHAGHYEFTVVPFGLSGAPGTFQGAMNSTLATLLRKCVVVFFDDILVYSRTYEEHVTHLRAVLNLLAKDQWIVKLKKCSFAQQEIHYLGHILSSRGVHTDPDKVSAVMHWPQPTSIKELRGFLGLAGFYRKFVRHFAILARPLTNLLKKHALFVWTDEHQSAFQALKQALCTAPVLATPDFTKVF